MSNLFLLLACVFHDAYLHTFTGLPEVFWLPLCGFGVKSRVTSLIPPSSRLKHLACHPGIARCLPYVIKLYTLVSY